MYLISGLKGRCHNAYLKISHVKSLHSDNNFFQQKLEKSFQSFPEMFNKILKDSDQSVKEKTQILCGKLEQLAESELQ